MIGDVKLAPWSIIMVDTWMWTPYVMLICLAGLRLDTGLHLRGRRGRSRLALAAVLVDHAADGDAVFDGSPFFFGRSKTSRCSTWSIS